MVTTTMIDETKVDETMANSSLWKARRSQTNMTFAHLPAAAVLAGKSPRMHPGMPAPTKQGEKCTKIGPYILTDTVGVGSFGKVKACVHQFNLARYACKVIEKSLIRDKMYSVQVQREISIMSRLRHPNTVSLVSVHSSKTKVFIIMEMVAGCELFDEILRLRRMSEPYARFYFRQLIQGLQYCHAHGIYHRDLKPDNLLINPDRTMKITDFGLATLKAGAATDGGTGSVSGSLNLHTQCGTPNYVAPEIINLDPSGYSGVKADTWACGIILYVLVAGVHPFDSRIMEILLKQIVRCQVTYPHYFSEDLKDLLDNLLKENAQERYTVAEVVQHPWYNGPTDRDIVGFPQKIPVEPVRTAPLPPSPIYPFPSENKLRGKTGDQYPGIAKNGPKKGSKDSLDFGSRVSSVECELSSLPEKLRSITAPTQNTSSTRNISGVTANGDVCQLESLLPASDSRNAGDEGWLGSRKDNSHESTTADYGPDEGWVLSDTDRLVWCRLMKDFDMVPDIYEFGVDSATLSEQWQKALEKEDLRKYSSFAADRFGVTQSARSRSAPYLATVPPAPEVGTSINHATRPDAEGGAIPFPERSGSLASSLAREEKGFRFEMWRHDDADGNINRETAVGSVSGVPRHANGELNEQYHDTQSDLLPPCDVPNPSSARHLDEQVPAPQGEVKLSDAYTGLLPHSGDHMNIIRDGRDLLEEKNSGHRAAGSTESPRRHRNSVLPVPSSVEALGIANILRRNRKRGAKVAAGLQTVPGPRGTSVPVVTQENSAVGLSPFAIDVPGPRHALPVTKALLRSIVPSTVSPRRLLRRSSTPLEIKSYTQFYSLLDPDSCFHIIQSVLRDYGCSITKMASASSREKFQIRCQSKKDNATVHARLSIYKVDDVLCTVHFKRMLHTDTKSFTTFYQDISRLYSESLKRRGLSEVAAKNESPK